MRTVSRLHLDLETWVKEGLVDEINLYIRANDNGIRQVVGICRDSSTKVSVFRSRGDLLAGLLGS